MAVRKLSKRPAKVVKAPRAGAETRAGVREVLAWCERHASPAIKEGMARYAIPSDKACGISVGSLRAYAKRLGRNHELALGLWATDLYEARMLATFLDDPSLVTPAQMDAWARDFDNWAICDTACFHLFDRTPHALAKVPVWARSREEFVRRAAFALLASLTVHGKDAPDEFFAKGLLWVEKAATDERNFVAKAVNWALRSIGKRSPELNESAIAVARRLASAEAKSPRWVGKDALRELTSASVQKRLAARASKAAKSKKSAPKRRK
jgi:3-methyladenine DNA glycosylase AlkD